MNQELKPLADRRRSFRAELPIPVLTKWVDKDGAQREEHSQTMVINTAGCLVLLKGPIDEGAEIHVTNKISGEERPGQVVYCGKRESDGCVHIGIALDNPDPGFWGFDYADFLLRVTSRWD